MNYANKKPYFCRRRQQGAERTAVGRRLRGMRIEKEACGGGVEHGSTSRSEGVLKGRYGVDRAGMADVWMDCARGGSNGKIGRLDAAETTARHLPARNGAKRLLRIIRGLAGRRSSCWSGRGRRLCAGCGRQPRGGRRVCGRAVRSAPCPLRPARRAGRAGWG